MEPIFVNTLVELNAARADIRDNDGIVRPRLIVMLVAQRTDLAGRHPPFDFPPLWLEPHEVQGLIGGLQAALAKKIPEQSGSPAQDGGDGTASPRLLS